MSGPTLTMKDCTVGNGSVYIADQPGYSGSAVHVEDASRVKLENCEFLGATGDGVHIDTTDSLNISNSVSADNRNAGYFVRDTGFDFDNVTATQNRVGLELGERAGGRLSNSRFNDNREVDIQYHRDNLVKIFNTEARNVRSALPQFDGLLRVNSGWVVTRILNTTDIATKARNVLKLVRWLGLAVVSSGALGLAKEVLMGVY